MILEIIRLEESFKYGTFGVLRINKEVFCVTLEPPDLLNLQSKSSIPAQQYDCQAYSSSRFPNTWQIMNVPGRDKVLFHSGNLVSHTEGCVLLAEHYGKLAENRAALNSGKTFDEFMLKTDFVDSLHLTILERY